MSINERLLHEAMAAGNRLASAERDLELARAEYHAIVRRMHLAGSSMREIAQALELSHQRIQQMVQGAGGSWWQRLWRHRNLKGNLSCSFCKRPQSELARLIAGPMIYICDTCVDAADHAMTGKDVRSVCGPLARAKEGSKARCSFCRKGASKDRALLRGPRGNICSDCIAVCRQVLLDSA